MDVVLKYIENVLYGTFYTKLLIYSKTDGLHTRNSENLEGHINFKLMFYSRETKIRIKNLCS